MRALLGRMLLGRATLILALAVLASASLEPMRIDIFAKHYVVLLVGTPGTRIKFFLNMTHNDVHISKSLYDRSQSFFASSDGVSGSESFFFGDHRIRLPVKFTSLDKDRTFSIFEQPFDGVLGLGPLSPLWVYWQRATVTPRRLYLGELRMTSLLDADEHPPVLPFDSVWSTSGPVIIHPFSVFSIIPEGDFSLGKISKIFGHTDLCNLIFDGVCLPEKAFQFGRLQLVGARSMHFEPVAIGGQNIQLGLEFFETHVVLIDRVQNVVAFSESIFSFKEYTYPSYLALLIAGIALPYSLIEFEHNRLLREIELFGLASLAVTFLNLTMGLMVSRHIRDYCEISTTWPFLAYIAFHILAFSAKILIRRPQLRYLERYLFICTSLLIMWLCKIEEHQSVAAMSYLLFLTTVQGFYTFFTLMDSYAHNMMWWPVTVLFAAMYVLFLYFGALLPMLLSTSSFTSWVFLDATLYLLVIVIAPAWVMQTSSVKANSQYVQCEPDFQCEPVCSV